MTYEDHLKAVRKNGYALSRVPEEFIDAPLCLAAVQEEGWALDRVPVRFVNATICLAAVQRDGSALRFVPDHFITERLCLAAVAARERAWAFDSVPNRHRKTVHAYLKLIGEQR